MRDARVFFQSLSPEPNGEHSSPERPFAAFEEAVRRRRLHLTIADVALLLAMALGMLLLARV